MRNQKSPEALARWKYQKHRAQSKFRKIDFLLTFDEWYNWWLSHGVDKKQNVKWTGGGRPCMCRCGDVGPYALNNIYFATNSQNVSDLTKHGRSNSAGRLTIKKFRYGAELVTYNELTTRCGVDPKVSQFFRHNVYDQENKKRSLKLHHRYFNIIKTHVREFQGANGQWFESRKAAAQSLKLGIDHYAKLLSDGKYQRRFRQIVPDFEDYLREHSFYPDPYIPQYSQKA